MILHDSFRKNHILSSTKEFEGADPSIIELVIYAFYLLEQLSFNKLDFVFKGGTSLMFYFDPPFRFSTDIDVVTLESRAKIEHALSTICQDQVFLEWKLDDKRSYNEGIPKAHYKLRFDSKRDDNQHEILLDVLFEENVYPVLKEFNVTLPYLLSDDKPSTVRVPSADSLLGDKLTAFAPRTVGIQFGKNKGRDIIKQVFDIGRLFDIMKDIEIVKTTFEAISAKEINYRNLEIGATEIAKDVLETSFLFARVFRNIQLKEEESAFNEIKNSLVAFRSFTSSKAKYFINSALLDASIAAYLTAIISTNSIKRFEIFDGNIHNLKDYYFDSTDLNYLDRLARFPNGTLYYLKSAYDLLYQS